MENTWKAILAAALTALSVYLQQMLIPVLVLILAMALDYVSGMVSAGMKGEISSKIGIRGIVKKVGYLVLVIVGMIMDYILQMGLGKAGIRLETYVVALLVTIWLIINELISIVENCGEIGLPVPEFMRKLLARMKSDAEEKAKYTANETTEEEEKT